jgi:hypothetical protein
VDEVVGDVDAVQCWAKGCRVGDVRLHDLDVVGPGMVAEAVGVAGQHAHPAAGG